MISPCDQLGAAVGKDRYGAGVWEDANGELHFSIPELLRYFGHPDTAENRRWMESVIRDVAQKANPGVKFVFRSLPS